MRVAIIGYGKMGREIERLAGTANVSSVEKIEISEIFDVSAPIAKPLTDADMSTFDVAIDFSAPAAVVENSRLLARNKKQIVVGTTGWYQHLSDVTKIIADAGVGLMYSPNYSVGVYLFTRLVRVAAREFQLFDEFDVAIRETHHRHKADAPSGTALRLGEVVLEQWKGKKSLFTGALQGAIPPDALQIISARVGEVAGEHAVTIDSASDAIEMKHTAKNRSGFALGALRAAQWLQGKKGMFTMDDFMADMMHDFNDEFSQLEELSGLSE